MDIRLLQDLQLIVLHALKFEENNHSEDSWFIILLILHFRKYKHESLNRDLRYLYSCHKDIEPLPDFHKTHSPR